MEEAANSENGALVIENEEEEGDVVSSGKGQGDTRNGSDKEDIKREGQSEVTIKTLLVVMSFWKIWTLTITCGGWTTTMRRRGGARETRGPSTTFL